MKPALSEKDSISPQNWQQFGQGEQLSRCIAERLQPWWHKIFGYYLLKVGDLSCQIDTRECKARRHLHLGHSAANIELQAEAEALPMREYSVDAVLLSHTLEFVADPHHAVREAHRVLVQDGYLLLTGVNPISVVGLLALLPWLRHRYPWRGRFFAPSRVKDWLHLVGFEVISEQRFFCSTMLGNPRSSRWQRWSEKHLNYFGASYLLVARKREMPLTPIRPKWQLNHTFNQSVKGISARQGCR